MCKVPELVFDEYMIDSFQIKTKKINSMTNKKYKSNIKVVREIIERNNQRYAEAESQAARLVLKSFQNDDSFSNSKAIADIQRLALEIKEKDVDWRVLNRVLDASMDELRENDFFSHTIDLRDLKNAKSKKMYNVRFNIKYCFEMLNDTYSIGKSVIDKDYLGLILSILMLLSRLHDSVVVSLDYLEALIVSVIAYQGGEVLEEKLISLVLKNDKLECCGYKVERVNISQALNVLSKLAVVKIENGNVFLLESVVI